MTHKGAVSAAAFRGRGNIYLTGFMGTGKTASGRLLAARLGRRFLDLDAVIERRAGRSVAELFSGGEKAFRRLESVALRRAARVRGRVVALGGGALLAPANKKLAQSTGTVVALTCARTELWRRLKEQLHVRPLLRGGKPRFKRLISARRAAYRGAAFFISTTRRTPAQVAALIARRLP